MTINAAFPHKCCINLERRPDRWRRMSDRFVQNEIEGIVRIAAVDGAEVVPPPGWSGTAGALGCLLSHVAAVRSARDAGADSLLIFEDDVEFATDFARRFDRAFAQVPDDWDVLYFGCIHRSRPEPVSESVARVSRAFSTFAYALRRPAFAPFLSANDAASDPVDVNLDRLHGELTRYCFLPHLAWVEPDFSDVQGMADDHWYIRESLAMGGDGLSDLIGKTLVVIPRDAPGWRRAGPDVLAFFIEHLRDALPGVEVAVVDVPGPVADGLLPSTHDMGEGFSYVLTAGSPVFVRHRHLRAALQMCRIRDLVLPFGDSVQLDGAGTREVLKGRGARLDASRYPRRQAGVLEHGWSFSTRNRLASVARGSADVEPFTASCLGLCLNFDDREHQARLPDPALGPAVVVSSVPSHVPAPIDQRGNS